MSERLTDNELRQLIDDPESIGPEGVATIDCVADIARELLQYRQHGTPEQVAELREAWGKYGGHAATCSTYAPVTPRLQCTCGFDSLPEHLRRRDAAQEGT